MPEEMSIADHNSPCREKDEKEALALDLQRKIETEEIRTRENGARYSDI